MNNKFNRSSCRIERLFVAASAVILAEVAVIAAQTPSKPAASEDSNGYVIVVVLIAALLGVGWWFFKSKKGAAGEPKKSATTASREPNSVDVQKEMEWLRKNQKFVGKKDAPARRKRREYAAKASADHSGISEKLREIGSPIKENAVEESSAAFSNRAAETGEYLPIFSIRQLEPAHPFDDLPISNDEALMDAIEQAYDETEEDSAVRELTVRVLAAFRTRNSVEALSQVALYDLLANLRSKAVTTLCEFDHESVFEPILLACADPTREVRAAAARGLTKLTFNRADAWTRLAELGTEGRVVAAARAAIESGFVEMSFDRLTHRDRKYAYEAFTLMALLIKSGETEKIFNALENHRDRNVRRAILHTIKIVKDSPTLEKIQKLLKDGSLPAELQEEIDTEVEKNRYITA